MMNLNADKSARIWPNKSIGNTYII
jgi:hypothetical protein